MSGKSWGLILGLSLIVVLVPATRGLPLEKPDLEKAHRLKAAADVAFEQEKYDAAHAQYEASLQMYETLNAAAQIADGFYNLGRVYHRTSRYDKAVEFLEGAVKRHEALRDRR